ADGLGFRPNEGEAGAFDLFGKVGVFSQEAVPRVDRRGAGDFGGRDDGRDGQVRLGSVCRANAYRLVGQRQVHQLTVRGGVYRHGLDTQFLAGTQDTQGDLAAVGNQNFFQLHRRFPAHQTMVNSGWSNSTG